ncbi:hypothetical protein GCM10009096_02820 [Parasphingorhabdus litoris]|uniref:SnoaL-like domain-containing protein n=1 Tax=Parasphingorhabdus litoris TaxID=394733 RepID=A0ABN1A264_9SPHN|nr:nuclear transport factor 2 family protein [Parasphingorhabdus litoris]
MNNEQASVDMIKSIPPLIPDRLDEARDYFADDFRWHYVNEHLPELNKTYEGVEGLKQFFIDLANKTGGSFNVRIKDAQALGNEFVIAHALPNMTLDGQSFETDAAVIWRIVGGKISEAWDIPGVNSAIRMDEGPAISSLPK